MEKRYGFVPDRLITDDLRSYGAAARDLGIENRHERVEGGIIGSRIPSADPTKRAQVAVPRRYEGWQEWQTGRLPLYGL
jgi:hypothetical protein